MNADPDDGHRQPAEPTFADAMNEFSFDSDRPAKRRRWGRRRGTDVELAEAPPVPQTPPGRGTTPGPFQPPPVPVQQPAPAAPFDAPAAEAEPFGHGAGASAVRPYAWTRGRTRSGFELAIETLVSTSARGREQMNMLQIEHRAVAELCEHPRSVAEIAALLKIPLGVARVLLGDMAGLGVVAVHQTASSTGSAPDLALMERVLSGLRRL